MAFPLLPFIAGAAIGGLATYLYENQKARSKINKAAGDVSDKVKQSTGAVTKKLSKGDGSSPKEVSDDSDENAADPAKKEAT